jgi:hypothetical protein
VTNKAHGAPRAAKHSYGILVASDPGNHSSCVLWVPFRVVTVGTRAILAYKGEEPALHLCTFTIGGDACTEF